MIASCLIPLLSQCARGRLKRPGHFLVQRRAPQVALALGLAQFRWEIGDINGVKHTGVPQRHRHIPVQHGIGMT